MITLLPYFLATELSQVDPLKDFQSWFFGSVAVLFIGLLVYNLLEMKQAIKSLTAKSHNHETQLALINQYVEGDDKIKSDRESLFTQMNKNFERLNQTLVLLTTERSTR